MKKVLSLVALCMGIFWSGMLSADTLRFQVTDQSGNPLKDAIIEITPSQPAALNNSETLVMDQVNKTFVPKVLVVPKGSQVSFPNSDDIRHHVYSFSKPKVFELKLYSGQPEAPIAFDQEGVVVLGCNIHDSMVGYLYVAQSPYVAISNEAGEVVLENAPEVIESVNLWHPDQDAGPEERKPVDPDKVVSGDVIPVSISVIEPAPRNTFEDMFRNAE